MAKPATNTKSGKGKTNEEIFANFQELRSEQRLLANKLSELGMDLNEHKIVIETLKGVEPSRKCFRMVGGVLVERTVQDILPELQSNVEQLPRAMRALEEQLTRKGADINDYIKNHDIRVQRLDRAGEAGAPPAAAPGDSDPPAKSTVLVPSA